MKILHQGDMDIARKFIEHGTGTLKDRQQINNRLCLYVRADKNMTEDEALTLIDLIEALRKDSHERGLGPFPPLPVFPMRGKSINPMPRHPRAQFELLLLAIVGGAVGDGTLEVTSDLKTYKNEHVQYMWMRFQLNLNQTDIPKLSFTNQ